MRLEKAQEGREVALGFGQAGEAAPYVDARDSIIAFGLREGGFGGGDVDHRGQAGLIARPLLLFAGARGG